MDPQGTAKFSLNDPRCDVLVLSRVINEEVISGGVRLKVLDAGHGRVRLGFTGPRDVLVCRAEVVNDRQVITMSDYVERNKRRKAG